ncbi:MAG: hypothetical protein QM528_00275 [Phycisphaerales bacterium]|nr:hypothetical protein [Phycisphaerales bacterium]
MKKTLTDAIIEGLENFKIPVDFKQICTFIQEQKLYDFQNAETPMNSVSSRLGNFIRSGDSRVKRMESSEGKYVYYLAKNETAILSNFEVGVTENSNRSNEKEYKEKSLHMLLSSYLGSIEILSKTISHEKSKGKDENQIWTHPDMIGIKFHKFQNPESRKFMTTIKNHKIFKLYSYEIKKDVKTDIDLKEKYFQAVSNSSWANLGYLVAYKVSVNLYSEIERLNESFGIGVIELHSNPFRSKVIVDAKFKDIDLKTIDKLCNNNYDFKDFVEKINNILNEDKDKNHEVLMKALNETCDPCLLHEEAIKEYCKQNHIPLKEKEEDN